MGDWLAASEAADVAALRSQVATLANELRATQESELALYESLASLAAEDVGWRPVNQITVDGEHDLPEQVRRSIAERCRVAKATNPLIIRGMMLRRAYIWGQGVTVSVDDDEAGQDLNAVIQAFVNDPDNRATLFGAEARAELEDQLGTDGEVYFTLQTDRITGRVRVHTLDPDEMTDRITDPDDVTTVWFYKREFQERRITATGAVSDWETRVLWYPAEGYNPRGVDRHPTLQGHRVVWNEPVVSLIVNKLGRRSKRGMGDIYGALGWAKASKEVLEAWVLLYKALARFAYQKRSNGNTKQQAAVERARAIEDQTRPVGNPNGVGATYRGGADTIEAVSKSGAMIDADGARPLISFTGAALGFPVTMLLGDPGVSGARAVAKTLDPPTKLIMTERRDRWRERLEDMCRYVLAWAVKTRRLSGTVTYVGSREVVTLSGMDTPISAQPISIEFPSYETESILEDVQAIVEAHGTGVFPPELTLRELLNVLKVPDADKIMDANTDDEGRFLPFDGNADAAAGNEFEPGDEEDTDQPDPDPEGDDES